LEASSVKLIQLKWHKIEYQSSLNRWITKYSKRNK
jgi:hypothetical protein